MRIAEFQKQIEDIYLARDSQRGLAGTHMWFCEEVGELTRALRRGERGELEGEFADVLAWLSTLASIAGVDLEEAARKKYGPKKAAAKHPRLRSTCCESRWASGSRTAPSPKSCSIRLSRRPCSRTGPS